MKHPFRDRARDLRSNLTDAELFVWQHLRYRQLGGYRFRRQFPFGQYILDFVCLEAKLVIELDGGQHAQVANYDERRSQWLQLEGFQVLRFWNHVVLTEWESVEAKIYETLQYLAHANHPHPNPPPSRGREKNGSLPSKPSSGREKYKRKRVTPG